jgi:hypothetical protein
MPESLEEVLLLSQRKLVVSEGNLSLDSKSYNRVFVLMVEESRGSAGGRAAGSGSRKINHVYGFSCAGGESSKTFETGDQALIELFDIPYSAVAMDIRLSDGRPFVVQGVVDSALVSSYIALTSNLK